jgi:hypothetical protein
MTDNLFPSPIPTSLTCIYRGVFPADVIEDDHRPRVQDLTYLIEVTDVVL